MSILLQTAYTPDPWIHTFFREKSNIHETDTLILSIAQTILLSETLSFLVKDCYESGGRFLGWTADGSRAYTDISTGHIRIGKNGDEALSLGYECINSKNKKLYQNIGTKYALKEDSRKNRENFAREIIKIEAQAMYTKCQLVTELELATPIKEHYLKIVRDEDLTKEEKIEALCEVMIEKGMVHYTKPAFNFYAGPRYDEFMKYYRKMSF